MIAPIAAIVLAAAEPPTANGDQIGVATRDAAGTITMRLRSVQCDGLIAESLVTVEPREASYAATLRWLGGIAPGETKPIRARDLEPCAPAR